ncbi:MAG: GTPase Era [Oscillospiraceae bacterium]|nr:GTPase Era [Oscillospiraceae bacterium]
MDSKTVFVSIVGRPNAGKSSLLNAMVGEKIAIVSDKPQTTRTKITGILTKDETQYVFIDTPGIHKAKTKLGEHMMKTVKDSVSDIDVIVFVADATKKMGESEAEFLESFKKSKVPVILVLNKIDLIEEKENLLKIIYEASKLYEFEAIVPVSVLENDGIELVLNEISKLAVESPHFFPDDMLTDQPERVIAAEIVREKFLHLLNEEIPHGIAVTVEEMKERKDKNGNDMLDVSANIFCEKDSHKGIIIGKNGDMLKKAGSLSRQEMEDFFGIKVNLQLWVKVKPDWRNKEGMIKNFGLANSK